MESEIDKNKIREIGKHTTKVKSLTNNEDTKSKNQDQSPSILAIDSTHWSNVTIRKKPKKKSYKLWKTPNNGKDIFDLDKEVEIRIEDEISIEPLIPMEIETIIREVE